MLAALAAMLMAGATPVSPSAEAERLGLRLARTGTLATLAPLLAAKDGEELVAAHPELSDAEKTRLRAVVKRTTDAAIERLNGAFGHAYAKRLSVAELRTLVAHAESSAAARWRTIMPAALTEAMGSAGTLDLKKDGTAAFCQETGKLCAK